MLILFQHVINNKFQTKPLIENTVFKKKGFLPDHLGDTLLPLDPK